MRRLFLLSTILVLSNALFSQDLPDWVKNPLNKPAGTYIGESLPSKEYPVERHIVALYDAMATYGRSNMQQTLQDTSRTVTIRKEIISGEEKDYSDMSRNIINIDWELIDNYVDNSGVEYVLLKIWPGPHPFIMEEYGVSRWDENGKFCYSISNKNYYSEVFNIPVLIVTENSVESDKIIANTSISAGIWTEIINLNRK